MENMRTDLWVSRITREEHQGDRFDTQGCPVATTAGFVLFKAEMVLQDQKGTKAKRDTEENKALRGPQATL